MDRLYGRNTTVVVSKKMKISSLKVSMVVVFAIASVMHNNLLAYDLSGTYSFKEKGMVGKMIVKEVGSKIMVDINTANDIPNVCDLQVTGRRVGKSKNSINAYFDYDQDKFEIIFTQVGATIKMLTEGPSVCCGRGAYYEGNWLKDRHMKKRK